MDIVKYDLIEDKIITLHEQKVILDSDVAEIYGVETKRINEAVRNNPEKFPIGYLIELTEIDWKPLKSKFSTSIKGGKVKLPFAFTEKGLYMLATILKGNKATQTTIAIIEAFAKIKDLNRTINELTIIKNKPRKQNMLQKSSEIIADLLDNDMVKKISETTIELNFAVLKFKHTIKKQNENDKV